MIDVREVDGDNFFCTEEGPVDYVIDLKFVFRVGMDLLEETWFLQLEVFAFNIKRSYFFSRAQSLIMVHHSY